MVIWKYPLEVKDTQTLFLPKGAQVLTVQCQNNLPVLWVEVSQVAAFEAKTFMTYGTGQSMNDHEHTDIYRGTYQLYDGALVFHVFEKR